MDLIMAVVPVDILLKIMALTHLEWVKNHKTRPRPKINPDRLGRRVMNAMVYGIGCLGLR